jgi:hypothetical protein
VLPLSLEWKILPIPLTTKQLVVDGHLIAVKRSVVLMEPPVVQVTPPSVVTTLLPCQMAKQTVVEAQLTSPPGCPDAFQVAPPSVVDSIPSMKQVLVLGQLMLRSRPVVPEFRLAQLLPSVVLTAAPLAPTA